MDIKKEKNNIYFNYKDIVSCKIKVIDTKVEIELLKVDDKHRGKKHATLMFGFVLAYIQSRMPYIDTVRLQPLPLHDNGLNIDQLKSFYSKYGFFKQFNINPKEIPYMIKYLI